MIKLRLATFKSAQGEVEIPIREGDTLDAAVTRVLEGIPLGDLESHEIFQVLVNGHHVPPELWKFTALKETDNVLVAPLIKGDDGGIFKQILVIAVVAVVSYFATPVYGAQVAGLISAGAAIGTSLLLNALIPPPVPDAGAIGGVTDISSSQMYSFTGQTNQTRKYQTVPRVYGTHRVYPAVAANPYTKVETDKKTKESVQYLYCVYDFGYGPLKLSDIRIGDTPISSYADASYYIVDPHKPDVSEGEWDDVTFKQFQHYKGGVSVEALSVSLNGNLTSGGAVSTYQVERTAGANPNNLPQEITLTFVNPQGLYSYSATGALQERRINLEIHFQKVGESQWYGYNDLNHVINYERVGGDSSTQNVGVGLWPPRANMNDPASTPGNGVYTLTGADTGNLPWHDTRDPYNVVSGQGPGLSWGYAPGTRNFVFLTDPNITVGSTLTWNTIVLGKVDKITAYSGAYSTYRIATGIPFAMPLFHYKGYDGGFAILPGGQMIGMPNKFYPWFTEPTEGVIFYTNSSVGTFRIRNDKVTPVTSTVTFSPRSPGQYKIRVTRIDTSNPTAKHKADALTLSGISTRTQQSAVQSENRHTFLELRIRATNQLNGAIQNLSAVATSVLDVYDPDTETWSKQATSNPAWVFVDLLTGEVNKRAIEKSRLHLPSILEWADYCDETPTPPPGKTYTYYRFKTNFILDYSVTLQGVLNQVTSSAQAGLNIINGKYGVLIDKLRTIPVQVFTPRNSKDFSSTRNYARRPDAVKVKFVDPNFDWQVNEIVVYDDGFDEDTALDFDELTCFACTNEEQAWRFGRYMIAQNRLRQETMNITVDFEYLVCTRGDYVQITQDVMKSGGTPARVKSITGNRVVIDDSIETDGDLDYGFVFRSPVDGIKTGTLTVVNSTTFDLDGADLPAKGDLIIIGEVGSVVYDCIVKSIAPNSDMSATLTLIEKQDAVYEAETLTTFPDYDPQFSATAGGVFKPPGIVSNLTIADNFYKCANSDLGYEYYVDLTWDNPAGAAFELFEIFANDGRGYISVGTTRNNTFHYVVDQTRLDIEHGFKVLAVSASGKKLELLQATEILVTPATKTARPSNIEKLSTDITGEVLQLLWPKIADCDCSEYLVRYSPDLTANWESSTPLLRVDRNVSTASTQARTGIYLIKAIDFVGNESEDATVAVTTIPNLFNLNVIEETDDFPDLNGTFDQAEELDGSIVLQHTVSGGVETAEYFAEGFYYYDAFLDLGEIYSVRLQSLIQAEGLTAEDLMENWTTLDAVLAMSNANHADWDVETQYRSTNLFNAMGEWTQLSLVDPISEGNQDNFTEWRKFIMGDATGRIFQFRLRLISNRASVSPRVFDGTIRADMPDRFESYNNLVAPDTGFDVEYDPPFAGPGSTPNIQISIDGGESGDYFILSDKTLEGFTIQFFDKNDNPVERQFDVAVKGYGRKAESII